MRTTRTRPRSRQPRAARRTNGHRVSPGQRSPCLQGNQPTRRRPQSMGLPMPIHAATGSRGGRPAAALIRSRRNVPHSISPLFGTLRPSPRRAVRSGAVTPRRMRFREQPRRLERLARALAVSLIVVWVAAVVGCRASDEAAPNTSSPHVAQPSEDVTPAPTREVARSSASAVEAQATPAPHETPVPPAATPAPRPRQRPPAATPAPPPAATPAPRPRPRARRLRRILLRAPRRPPLP